MVTKGKIDVEKKKMKRINEGQKQIKLPLVETQVLAALASKYYSMDYILYQVDIHTCMEEISGMLDYTGDDLMNMLDRTDNCKLNGLGLVLAIKNIVEELSQYESDVNPEELFFIDMADVINQELNE